jgi:glucokinase
MDPSPPPSPTFLVADIGGTNARFALATPGTPAAIVPGSIEVLRVADFPTPVAAALHYLERQHARPSCAVLAIAGPTDGETAELTNHRWSFSADALRQALRTDAVRLTNDFAAIARALPDLGPDDVRLLGPAFRSAAPGADRTLAVLGPGTGLGIAAVALRQGAPLVLETEGGHASFAPVEDDEVAILGQLARRFGRVSWERLLSGPGLANIDAALRAQAGVAGEPLAPAAVTARAASGDDPVATRSVEVFCALLGAFAGDVALLYGAWDGVFIAGGIAPRLGRELAAGRFRARFEAKGRFSARLATVPAAVIVHPFPGLLGAAGYASALAA